MGADLYLSSVLDTCFTHYGQAFRLVQTFQHVLEGDLTSALGAESLALKAALQTHAEQAGTMSPALFDLVAEIADLAQGEGAVWEQALANQIAMLIEQNNSPVGESDGDIKETASLAHDLVEILKGRTDATLTHTLPWPVQRMEMLVPQVPEEERALTQTLAELCQSMRNIQQGQPAHALSLVVDKHVLPQLEQACADQASCLRELAQVLQPLQSALSAGENPPREGVDFAPAQALSRWLQIAQRLHNVLAALRDTLRSIVHQLPFPIHVAASQIDHAWEQAQDLWREGGVCQEELANAMGALGALLMRTLPPLTETAAGQMQPPPGTTSVELPAHPIASPLRQAFGIVFKHHLFCHGALHLLEHTAEIASALLTGDQRQGLLALSEAMISLLAAAQSSLHEEEEEELLLPCAQQVSLAAPVPLTSGVTLVPGTAMDTHYLGALASLREIQQERHAQEWVKQALGDTQATHPGGLIVSFWRLLQGETTLWAILLTRILEEHLAEETDSALAEVRVRLIQLQHILGGDSLPRLQAVLAELAATIPVASPLERPTTRLQDLTQQQRAFALQEILQALSQEIQDQADWGTWPDDRVQDLRWLLDLTQALLQAPAADQPSLLLTTLAKFVLAEAASAMPTEEESIPAPLQEEVLQRLAIIDNDQDRLRIVAVMLAALPAPELHAPRADPRYDAGWRLRLFRDLLGCMEEDQPAAEGALSAEEERKPLRLLGPLAACMACLLLAWLFPPEGYFRDPYNDGSTLWVAAGLFWPAIAHIIAEPLDEQHLAHKGWHTGEGEIPAQIPVEYARHLVDFMATRSMHLPSREQLARWGEALPVEEDGPYSMSKWHAHLAERKLALQTFLEGAIARNEPILCSL